MELCLIKLVTLLFGLQIEAKEHLKKITEKSSDIHFHDIKKNFV